MIPLSVKEGISHYLGSTPKPYLIPSFNDPKESNCEYWNLPPQKDEDKPIHLRYQEITSRIHQLLEENKNDPQIELLVQEANELLSDIPVTRKYGFSWVSQNDILKLDKAKGIRKEWWDLHSRFTGSGVCIFQGYKSAEALATRIADLLIIMPNEDQYEFLRINQTRGNNYLVDTDRIIDALDKIDGEYGIVIISALLDFVEFIFEKPVEVKSRARIRQRLHRLCPSAEELTGSIRSGRVALWWD
jgi:hypothetical protein